MSHDSEGPPHARRREDPVAVIHDHVGVVGHAHGPHGRSKRLWTEGAGWGDGREIQCVMHWEVLGVLGVLQL